MEANLIPNPVQILNNEVLTSNDEEETAPTKIINNNDLQTVDERSPLLENDMNEEAIDTIVPPPPDKYYLVYAIFFLLGM